MKKVMICAITLLPLILLLTLFISTAVIGFSTYVYVTSVEFVEDEIYLKKIDGNDVTEQLKVNVFPLQADNKEVEYWSDDTSIVTIDADGKVTSVNFGSTYVRVCSKEKPSLQSACKVTVTDDKIHSLTIVEVPTTLFFGESVKIECSYVPTDATNIDLLYKSSDESLATVAADGTITANRNKGGYVTITAWSKANPLASAEITIKIYGRIQSIDFLDHADIFDARTSFELPQISIYPENASWGNEVSYSINDESIAWIENNSIVFKKSGKITLSVKDEYGHEITKNYESTWGHYDSISFTEDSTEIVRNFEDYSLNTPIEFKYTATPATATENISLDSSDASVIYVKNGKFYVNGGGKATISMQITTYTGKAVTTKLTVTIKRKADSVDFLDENGNGGIRYAISKDNQFQINTKILPSDSSDNVLYSIVDGGEHATVNNVGLVSFKSNQIIPQSIIVRATANSGVSRDIKITYIPNSSNPIQVVDNKKISLVMPLSHLEQQITFAPYYELYSDSEITFEAMGDGISIDGLLVAITKSGTFILNAKKDGVIVATTEIIVTRKAERVSADLYAVWEGLDSIKWNGESAFYTSAKEISIQKITILPSNATKQVPDLVAVSSQEIASIVENDGIYSITFIKAGTVDLTISVDDTIFRATVTSTYGLLDDKAVITVNNNKETDLRSTLTVSDLINVVTYSPINGNIANTEITIVSGNATLSLDKQSVTFTAGGNIELQVSYDTVSGRKTTNKIKVHVNEDPTDILLKKGAFTVSEGNSIDLSELFSIVPSTANHNNAVSYTFKEAYSYATVTNDNLTFTDAGIVTVTISLSNGINKDIAIAYYGEYNSASVTVIDGINYIDNGSTFVIRLSKEILNTLTADNRFISTDTNITITNGLIVKVNKVGAFSVTIGESSYNYESVIKASGVDITLTDNTQANEKADGSYITGLTSINLSSSILGENVTYSDITYSVNNDIATVSNDGILTFNSKGTVTVTASERFGKSASITIESTCGNFTLITAFVSAITLDYDDDNLLSGYDFSSFFTGYPTQLSLNDNATIEVTVNENGVTSSIDGFTVSLSGRASFTVTCKQDLVSASISVTINRKVSDIYVNDTKLSVDGSTIFTADRSFIDLSVSVYPKDANNYSNINISVADGDYINYGTWDAVNDRLTFKVETNRAVKLLFGVGGISREAVFKTTRLTKTVYASGSESIVVSVNEPFAFGDYGFNEAELIWDDAILSNIVEDGTNYKITKSGAYTISYGGAVKTVVVASKFKDFENVSADDIEADNKVSTPIINESIKHYTASSKISITFAGVGNAINHDGTVPTVKYAISSGLRVASIGEDTGLLVFTSGGEVVVTITVSGTESDGSAYSEVFNVTVISTYGLLDDKAVITVNNNKETDLRSTLTVSDLINVVTYSPINGNIANTEITIVSGNATLSEDKQSVTFTAGGNIELQVSYDTVSGRKTTNKIKVHVNEDPTDILLKKGAFTVSEGNSIDLSELFSIVPSTANHNNAVSYTFKEAYSYATVTNDNLTFTDAGIVTVTISLSNGINKDIAIAYYGEYNSASVTIIDGVNYIDNGSTFVIRLSEEILNTLTADNRFISTDTNITITNGLIVKVNEVGAFSVNIGESSYDYESVIKASGVDITLTDNTQANEKADSTYITGLTSINLSSSILGENVTYSDITYSVNNDIATVSNDGILTFNSKGTVTVTASERFGKSASITIESTYGNFTSITASSSAITLDYDDDKLPLGYDFSSFFTGYPTQLSLSEKATIEVTVNENGVTSSIDGFTVSLSGRVSFTVTCKQDLVSASISVTVNRKATSMSINGIDINDINGDNAVDIARSFIDLKLAPVPSDANQYTDISTAIATAYADKATIIEQSSNAWRLTLSVQDEIIPLTFTYANGVSKTLKYTTTQLSQAVDFDSDPIVVVKDEFFTFGNEGLSLSELVLSGADGVLLETSGSNYRIATSGSYVLSGKNNGVAFTKNIIVTHRFDFDRVSVNVFDKDLGGNDITNTIKNNAYSTASNSITFGFDIGDAINHDGTVPTVKYAISSGLGVASIGEATGLLVFTSGGEVVVTITVSGTESDGSAYSEVFNVTVTSTYGLLDDKSVIAVNDSINKAVGATLSISEILTVTNRSPNNGNIANTEITIVSGNATLSLDKQSVTFTAGGNIELQVSYDTVSGRKTTNKIKVRVNEDPTDILLKKGAFTVSEGNSIDLSELFSIVPSTANHNNAVSYTFKEAYSYATVTNDNLTFTDAGIVTVTISLSNGINKDIAIAYYGEYNSASVTIIDGVNYIDNGSTFVIRLSEEILNTLTADNRFISTDTNITITNGLIVKVNEVGAFSVNIGESSYDYESVIKASGVDITLTDNTQANEKADSTYITGLTSINLSSSILGENVTYSDTTYSVNNDIATVSNDGILTFTNKGTVIVTASERFGKSASITIESTYGTFTSITASTSAITLDYDNDNLLSGYDFSSFFTGYPTQLSLSEKATIEVTVNENGVTSSIDGFTVSLSGRASFTVTCKQDLVSASISVTVNRKVSDIIISIDGVNNSENAVSIDRSFADIRVAYIPTDANLNTNIGVTVDGGTISKSGNDYRLSFAKLGDVAEVTVENGAITKTIAFTNDMFSENVLFDNSVIVVAKGELFTFSDINLNDTLLHLNTFDALETVGNNYRIKSSGKYDLSGTTNGVPFTKELIVTASFAGFTNVKIDDKDHNGADASVNILEDGTHSTASKSLSVNFGGVGDAFSVNGTAPIPQFRSDNDSIATIDSNGSITFHRSGTVTVTITVSGEVYSNKGTGGYSNSYTFKVYSSFGFIDEFTLENADTTQNIVIDDISEYTLKCTPILPELYGVFTQEYIYNSSNESVATVENGIVSFHGTGKAIITISAVGGDGTTRSETITFNVDKLIDSIRVIDNNDKQRSQIIVNTNSYQLITDISTVLNGSRVRRASATVIEPTLTTLMYSVKDNASGCSVDNNGLITFSEGAIGKFVIVIKAQGSAKTDGVQYEFPIIKVASDVCIITVDVSDASVLPVFESGKSYVIDAGFGSTVPTVTIPTDIGTADALGVFTTSKGVQADIEIEYQGSSKQITAFVEQEVEYISLNDSAPSSVYGGAITFNLTEIFGASVYPATAGRVVDDVLVYYAVQYNVSDLSVAEIVADTNGDIILTFINAGSVVVTFSAGGASKQVSIQSTFGFADEIIFDSNYREFNFTDNSYTFTDADYTVNPSDADANKYNLTVTSSNTSVLAVNGLTVTFVGGGEATLTFEYNVSSDIKVTLTVAVRVIKHANGISVSYLGTETQNILTADGDISLVTAVLGANLSPYTVEYVSSDPSVASVDSNGRVTILQKGVACTITVSLTSQYDSVLVAQRAITVRQAPYTIKSIDNENDLYEFNYGTQLNYSLYYSDSLLPALFEITDSSGNATNSDVVSINEHGDITLLSAGSAFITVTDQSEQSKTFEIRVYKKAENILFSSELDAYLSDGEYIMASTSTKLFDSDPLDAILPLGASYGKTVEFSYDSSVATIDENGNVTFLTNGTLVVTVLIKRAGDIDLSKEIKLRSTLGNAITAKVYKDGSIIDPSYSIDVGNSIVFNIRDLKPLDLQLTDKNLTAVASTTNVVAISVDADNKAITVTAIGKGNCVLTINVAGQVFTVNITSVLKVSSVEIHYNNEAVTTVKTLNSQIMLTAIALPTTANNTAIQWILPDGVTMDADNNLIISAQGSYYVTARATDGSGCSATVEIVYQDLSGFGLMFNGEEIQDDYKAYLAYNENNLTFTVIPKPYGLQGVSIEDFEIRSAKGYTYGIIRDQASFKITLTTPASENELHFEDDIEITYKGLYASSFTIYRSGVKSISFKYYNPLATAPTNDNLDNALDGQFGYQQIRVFGNQSYYGGIQGYYKMYVEVKPQQDYLQYVDFVAEKGLTVTKDLSDNSFVYVNFNGYSGSSLNAILADLTYDFSDAAANVSATDIGAKLGTSACSYNFHIVSGVNVFDKEGYLNGGSNVVLHVNLTHDDEDTSNLGNRSRFDGYASSTNTGVVNKTTLYGNGYLINFANKNNYKTKTSGGKTVPEAETSYGYTPISIKNVINANIKGTNTIVAGDSDRKYYFIELSGVSNIYYTEAYNMLRVIENYNSITNIKRCLFRTCAESGAISSYKDGFVDSNSMNFTDVIMFDTGSRAIETHSNPIRVYGFLDVYNFQNKKAFNNALTGVNIGSGAFGEITGEHPEFIETINGEKWFNMVALSAKGKDKNMYYNDELVVTSAVSKNGLKKIEITYALIYKFSIWGYPTGSAPIKWEDQFNSNGVLDHSKMMGTTWKITRTQQRSA